MEMAFRIDKHIEDRVSHSIWSTTLEEPVSLSNIVEERRIPVSTRVVVLDCLT
jgi:adenosyl cobinamide kinase/adenosyl cobinamide phosphate guanylyltransferase